MQLKSLCVAAVVTLTATAAAGAPAVFPLEQVRPGQKGYGLTTMKGTEPERFAFEVIGVNRNFLPKMDIILVKSDDPKLKVTGFWQGMSGSPLYIEGKLTCAFSYGFRFNKVAIGGCTPIHYMKIDGFRRARGLQSNTLPSSAGGRARVQSRGSLSEWRRLVPRGDLGAALSSARSPWLLSTPRPRQRTGNLDPNGMTQSAVPLSMSGFSAPAFAKAKEVMSGFAIEPMQGGGTGDANSGPTKFTMGGSISVQLVRGDMSMAGTGTVSYVDGSKILAFGHPMFQAGEIYAPVTSAEVHTVIPSAFSAFVVASPMRELGTLIQDRQSTIMADTSRRTGMIPVHIRIKSTAGTEVQQNHFDVEILNNRFFSGALAGIAAMSAMSLYVPDRDDATVRIDSRVHIKGYKPLTFSDYIYSEEGPGGAVGGARGLRVLGPLLTNPFSPVEITAVEVDMDIRFDTNYGIIEGIRLPMAELTPGKRAYADVVMRQFNGRPVVERVPFDVPARLEGSVVKLEVSAGDNAPLDIAPPESLDDLIAALRTFLPGNTFAVSLISADEGITMAGRIVRDMPASVLDKLNTTTSTTGAEKYKSLSRSVAPATRVIRGQASTLVKIAPLKK